MIVTQNVREIKGSLIGLEEGKLKIQVFPTRKIELVTPRFDMTPQFISDWIEEGDVRVLVIDDKAVQVKRWISGGKEIRYPKDL